MAITTTINKTEASIGEDIICSTSGGTTNISLTYWIVNFTSADETKTLSELNSERRVFALYNGNTQSTVPITTNHLNLTSLTSVMLVTYSASTLESLRNTPINEGGNKVYVQDTFLVTINNNQEPIGELDIAKYYVNITKQPVEDLDSVTVEINNEYDNRFDIVSSSEYTDLRDTFETIKENNKEEIIRPQIEEVMDDYRNGDVPFPYSTYAVNLKKNGDIISFEDVKETIEGLKDKVDSETVNVRKNYTATTSDAFCKDCWSETSGQGGTYSILNQSILWQSIKKFKYENTNTESVRLTVRLGAEYPGVYIHTDGTEVSSNNNSEYEMEYGEDYVYELDEHDTLFIYALNSASITYTVESIKSTTINAIADIVYPVGSIYISVNTTSPQELWGGEWEQIKSRFLIGCTGIDGDYPNDTDGGTPTVSLNQSQMPRHTHTQSSHNHTQEAHTHSQSAHKHKSISSTDIYAIGVKKDDWYYTGKRNMTYTSGNHYYPYTNSNKGGIGEYENTGSTTATNNSTTAVNKAVTAVNQYTGGMGSGQSESDGSPFSIIPPFLAVYMWKRTL